jgi:hypothetical protein
MDQIDRRNSLVHNYTGGPRGKDSEAPHINDSSTWLSVLFLYFAEIVTLLVVETNQYWHCYLDILDDGLSLVPHVTEAEIVVLA